MVIYTWIWASIGAVWRNRLEARYLGYLKWAVKLAAMLLLAVTYLIPMIIFGSKPLELIVRFALG